MPLEIIKSPSTNKSEDNIPLLGTEESQTAEEFSPEISKKDPNLKNMASLNGQVTLRGLIGFFIIKLCNIKMLRSCPALLLTIFWKHIAFSCVVGFLLLWYGYGGFVPLLLIILSILSVLICLEHKLVYFPDEPATSRLFVEQPAAYQLPGETVILHCGKIRLHAYLILQPAGIARNTAPTLLFLHGNAGNIGHRLNNVAYLYQHCGINVMLLEYRGYGLSNGTPSEMGLYADAETALNYLRQRPDIHPGRLVLFGRSLGGAVAVNLALVDFSSSSRNTVHLAGLILENTFTSLPAVGKDIFKLPFIHYIPDWCVTNQFQSLRKLAQLSVGFPVLFISGQADNLVPPSHMTRLYNGCGSQRKRIIHFPQGGHNDTWLQGGYFESLSDFFNSIRSDTSSVDSFTRYFDRDVHVV